VKGPDRRPARLLRLRVPLAQALRARGVRWAALLALLALLAALGLWAGNHFSHRDRSLARLRESGVWRVGLDPSFPPFEQLDTAGHPVGFDVDLAAAIAGRLGVRLDVETVGFDELMDAVAAGRVDAAISALPIAGWRREDVSFSAPYIEAGVVLAAPAGSTITGTESLAGRRVAVEWGSEGDSQARALQKGRPRMTIVARESPDDALAAVGQGGADAAIIDAISLDLFDRDGGHLVAVGPPLVSDPYAIVLPHDADALRKAVDDALAALKADGTLARIRQKWLGAGGP
jgi:polar amino acid transport system substrate-binding protein